jgi:hypothetical protein
MATLLNVSRGTVVEAYEALIVEPEYLKEIRALPDRFSMSDISELRDHGITAKYIRNLHDMGMKNLTAAQIVHLREGN